MFPPSDSNSLENSSDNLNGKSASASLVDDQRVSDGLIPYNGAAAPAAGTWPFGFPTRPEILTAKPDISNLLQCLRRRKWLAIFLGLLVGGSLAAIVWVLFPTQWESMALLQVHTKGPTVFSNDDTPVEFEQYKRNIKAVLTSGLVLNKALDDKTIQNLPLVRKNQANLTNWLRDSLNVETGYGELVTISMKNEDSHGISQIIDAVVASYKEEVIDKEHSDKLARKLMLEKKYRDYKQTQLEKQRQLFDLSQQIGTADAQAARTRYKMEVDQLDALMRQRTEGQKTISDLELKIALAKLLKQNAEKNQVPEEDIEAAISKDPRIQQALNDLSQLMREQRELEKVIKNKNDPSLVRIRDAIKSVRENMEEIKNEDRQSVVEQLRRQGETTGSNMQTLELERQLLIAQLNQTMKNIDAQSEAVQKLERFNGDADQLRADIEQQKGLIADMNNTLARWNIELEAPSRVAVYQAATPAYQIRPLQQPIMAVVAGFLGFGLTLFGVTFFEFLTRKLNAAHELADGLGIRVMGDLPALRRGIGLRQRSRRAMHGLVAESINGIRATLLRNANVGQSNVFLVTSAGESEGKTTVASQLAASLARGGRKTLLIDADLRHPGAHLVFGLPNEEGLSELLRGEIEIDDAVRATPADNLWMVSAGQCCASAVMALGKEAVADVLGRLEARFEFIVIDTGPVLKVADALLLGPHIDGAILSVLRDVSRIHKVYEANERLKLAGVKVVGAVINGIEDRGSFDRYHVEMSAA